MSDPHAALAALKRARPSLVRGAVTLRPIEEGDVTPVYPESLNDPEVARFIEAAQGERQTLATVTEHQHTEHSHFWQHRLASFGAGCGVRRGVSKCKTD